MTGDDDPSTRPQPIFADAMGSDFRTLPTLVQTFHSPGTVSRWHGRASVQRGDSLWSQFLANLFGFPKTAAEVPVEVVTRTVPDGEIWERRFGEHGFSSKLAVLPSGLAECFGPFTFHLGLEIREESLHYNVVSGNFGPAPLPSWLLPISRSREFVENDRFRFDIRLLAPITRKLLVHYRGELTASDSASRIQPLSPPTETNPNSPSRSMVRAVSGPP